MTEIIEKSYAKLNLALDVLARREDGYHELSMIMQSINLCDAVRIASVTGTNIAVATDQPHIDRKSVV